MRHAQRFMVKPGFLAIVLLVMMAAWSPVAMGQEAGTPVPMTETDCGAAGMSLPGEIQPEGVGRELLVTAGIDSTSFAIGDETDLTAIAVASIVCIAANTDVIIGMSGSPDTAEIPQDFTVTLVVLEGELELKLVKGCAGTDCTVTDGVATFRTPEDYPTSVAIGADWTPIPAGSIVVLTDVTISMRTGDVAVRLLSTGVVPDIIGGGACPTSCANWRNP